jgi:hypothetical protein
MLGTGNNLKMIWGIPVLKEKGVGVLGTSNFSYGEVLGFYNIRFALDYIVL